MFNLLCSKTVPLAHNNFNNLLIFENNLFCFLGFGRGRSPVMPVSPVRRPLSPDHPNPALPITDTPSSAIGRMGWALRTLLVADNTSCLKDRKVIFEN